jgi:two-component system nitrogen regulation sensor histidine kinase NtrY
MAIRDLSATDLSPGRRLPHGAFGRRRGGAIATLLLVAAGPIMAAVTALVFSRAEGGAVSVTVLRAVLLADLIYILLLAGLIVLTIARIVAARRARSAGARLHLRLVGLFTVVALAPTILVAVFATLTVNFGIEGWFSTQVRSVVANALSTAEAYEREHRGNIEGDALAMANDINRAAALGIDRGRLGDLVRQQALIREMPEAYVLDDAAGIVARGEFSYLFTLEAPSREQFDAARAGEVVVIEDLPANEMRALVYLTNAPGNYLFVTRRIDGEVLQLLDETRETVALYERMESERATILFDFALLYLGFALLVMMGAVWLGLRFAEGLARPIGRLAAAAERVGAGDFDLRVRASRSDDEVAVLGRAFNRMTEQVKRQRDALVDARDETERRRAFIETVLSGVSAGVIGLDAEGRVELMNASARVMLGVPDGAPTPRRLADAAPALAPLLARTAEGGTGGGAQEAVRVEVNGRERELMARMTARGGDAKAGAVLTLDDMTDLVAAQRMAAWGDVARRIAHEIKNPLTPIQLSADRLKRKFTKLDTADREALTQYADVIARQADDIRRMVDAFSKFARMPEAQRRAEELGDIVNAAVLLQREGNADIDYAVSIDGPAPVHGDRAMLTQALTNLLKNAAESIAARRAASEAASEAGGEAGAGRIAVRLSCDDARATVEIEDDGVGLPQAQRDRLTEPYVTTRSRGTGLGLAIVKKIVELHDGALTLADAPCGVGALARIALPLKAESNPEKDAAGGPSAPSAQGQRTE